MTLTLNFRFPTIRSVILVATVLLFSRESNAAINKPPLFPDGQLSSHVDPSFWSNLKPTQSTWDRWGTGWIPEACRYEALSVGGFNLKDFEVFNVHYTDCDQAWVFCRHTSAPLSLTTLIDLFGRLPVHERQWIQHIMATPGGSSAYFRNAVIVMQGSVGVPSVFQHETGHSMDFYKTGTQSSNTGAFQNSVNQDSCIPDTYSATNFVEDYAQVSVISLYEIVTPGGLDTIGANWRCLVNQKNVLDSFQRDHMRPGGRCDRRWADSAPVSTNSKKRNEGMPLPAIRFGQPNVFEIPFSASTKPQVYKNLVFNQTEEANAIIRQAKWARLANKTS